MKVNITQDGKKKEFNIISNWEDVTLEKWAELIAANKNIKGKKAKEAINTIKHLSDMPQDLIEQFNLSDISKILEKIADIQARANSELVSKITVNDKEYGFHPNLEEDLKYYPIQERVSNTQQHQHMLQDQYILEHQQMMQCKV